MGIRDDVQQDLAPDLDAGGELYDTVEAFEAKRTVAGGYDPVTGSVSNTVETFTGRWIRVSWSRQELDSQHIESTDLKRVVLQNETNWMPAVDDVVDSYVVQDVQQDGAGVAWSIQLRRT